MSTETTEPDTKARTVAATILLDKRQVTVLAEATDTPGLVITPDYDSHGFSDSYTITHTSSGMRIPLGRSGVDLYTARRIADELGKLGIDWTLPGDTFVEQFGERRDDVAAAIHRSRWVYTGDDIIDPGKPLPIGEYPRNAAEATAQTMIAAVLRDGLQRTTDTWALISYDINDKTARDACLRNTLAMLSDYGFIAALRALRAIEPAAADTIARDVWAAFNAGDSIHDEIAEWGAELGLPIPRTISAAAAKDVAEREARTETGSSSPV